MAASLVLRLDTAPPANPLITIAGGAGITPVRLVQVALATSDYQAGAADVADLKIWGDVDLTANPSVQPLEAASAWVAYAPLVEVTLSSTNAVKRLWARLRDRQGNVTLAVTATVQLDSTLPYVTITAGLDRDVVSLVPGHELAAFTWVASHSFDRHEVRVVPYASSPQGAGFAIDAVDHSPAKAANTPVVTDITGAELAAASPGDGAKVVKVFVRSQGRWSV